MPFCGRLGHPQGVGICDDGGGGALSRDQINSAWILRKKERKGEKEL